MASSNGLYTSRWPKVTSSYHTGMYCGPCYICGKEQERYDHFSGLACEVQLFLQNHVCAAIPANSCICRSHRREVSRHYNDTNYTPVWKKEKAVMQTKCIYSECVATSADTKIITPSSEYQLSFREVLNTEPDSAITLCDRHYQLVYREVHMHKVCAGCGAKPKARQSAYTRHSPDAESVCQYLNEHTEFSLSLTQEDTLCKSCYDLHLVILQNMEKQLTPQQDLESDIKLWSMTIRDDSITEVTRAVLVTVLYTAKLLLETKALLLPQAAIVFRQNYSIPEEDGDLNLEVRDGTIKFTGKWLMSQLIIHLQPYMDYKCIVPRLGTLLYPRNGDLMKSPNVCIVPVTLQ